MLEHLNDANKPPSRVVVMGAGGFVGGAIAARLAALGVPTLALGRRDVDLEAVDGADRLAAALRPGDSFVAVSALAPVKNLELLARNITMLRAMTEALRRAVPSHILNIGSDAVFADEPRPLNEATPKAPGSLHGVMHAAREIAFTELGVPLATLRPTLIYGAADPHNGYGPNRFLRLAQAGKEIVLFGEGEERRDHVAVEDVADLAVRMLLRRSRGSLNAATGEVWSFRAAAELAVMLSGRPVAVTGSPRQGAMPHGGYRPFDPAATRAAFPDFRYTTLPDGLARMARALATPKP